MSRARVVGWLVVFAACPGIVIPRPAVTANDECARLYAEADLAQAEVQCDHALEYQPRYWNALHNKGLIHLARGDRAGAKELFIKALRANPELASAYNMLGFMALEDLDFTTARDRFLTALRMQPEFLAARENLARAYLGLKDYEAAEKAYRHLIVSRPDLSEAYQRLGALMLIRDRPADALPWFQQALTLEANYVDAWKGLGSAYTRLGRRDEAKDAFDSCLIARADDADCAAAIHELSQ